jgi:hypothetical protein
LLGRQLMITKLTQTFLHNFGNTIYPHYAWLNIITHQKYTHESMPLKEDQDGLGLI